jgi:hypothetical protein
MDDDGGKSHTEQAKPGGGHPLVQGAADKGIELRQHNEPSEVNTDILRTGRMGLKLAR